MFEIYTEELKEFVSNSLIKNFNFKKSNIKKDYSPKNFKWRPNLYAKKEGEEWAILIKTSSSLPDAYWNLFIESLKFRPSIRIYLAIPSSCKQYFYKKCCDYGIGILEIKSRSVNIFYEPPFRRRKYITKKNYKVFYCFLSSIEELPERRKAEDIINKCGFWIKPHVIRANCIERTGYHSSSKLWEKIKNEIKSSHYFVAIVNPQKYSPWVAREIQYAFLVMKRNKIAILTKLTPMNQIDEKVKKLLMWLEPKIQYAKYDNNEKFEESLSLEMRRLLKPVIKQVYQN